jgi:hypothetical protein
MKPLINPKTGNYHALKEIATSKSLQWYYQKIIQPKKMNQLQNPQTDNYKSLKEWATGSNLPWFAMGEMINRGVEGKYDERFENREFLSHRILAGPEHSKFRISEKMSDLLELSSQVIFEIAYHNELTVNALLRVNLNMTLPTNPPKLCPPHVDHEFPHQNLLLYFTSSGGATVCFTEEGEKEFEPQEDDVLLMQGLHSYRTPLQNNRIILVATFI